VLSDLGRILFELEGVENDEARRAMALASAKLPMRTKFVRRAASGKVPG
jgi:large subunit ribosomal protein L16